MAHYRTTVTSPAGADTAYDYLADFASVNEVYGKVFGVGGPAPARSTVQVAALPKGVKVEIEAVAQVDKA